MNLFQTSQASTIYDIILILLSSLVSGLIIAYIYRKNTQNLSAEIDFSFSLTLLTIIVSIVMFVIGSSITLSLGLLGALSIIRFRTPIKNTSDMVYIFWTIATGLSIGAQNHIITISSVIFLSLVITIFKFKSFENLIRLKNNYILSLTFDSSVMGAHKKLKDQMDQFNQLNKNFSIELNSTVFNNQTNIIEESYSIKAKDKIIIDKFIDELNKNEKILQCSLLHPDTNTYL
jgi:uncharacterized membrane protein YhiD involved in acid resistance